VFILQNSLEAVHNEDRRDAVLKTDKQEDGKSDTRAGGILAAFFQD